MANDTLRREQLAAFLVELKAEYANGWFFAEQAWRTPHLYAMVKSLWPDLHSGRALHRKLTEFQGRGFGGQTLWRLDDRPVLYQVTASSVKDGDCSVF